MRATTSAAPATTAEQAAPASATEQALADLLAEVLRVERVPVDDHFFDDLGADSLLMAGFCARARKRADLPSISVEDVYRHPTIRALAEAAADNSVVPAEAPVAPIDERKRSGPTPVDRRHYIVCGALQLAVLLAYASIAVLLLAAGVQWIRGGSGAIDVYLRSVAFGSASFLAVSLLPILAKWTLIGRWKREEIRIWSLRYVRFWVVSSLVRLNPMVLFAGSPLYLLYLRALGAKIGRGAVIFSRHAPVCTDLLRVGAGAVIRKDSFLTGYRADAGVIRTGAVTVGEDALVGDAAVLDIDTSLGARAQLGHASSLCEGQSVAAGQRRQGSPASEDTGADLRALEPASGGTLRRVTYSALQLVALLAVSFPLAVGAVYLLGATVPQLAELFRHSPADVISWAFLGDALIASFVLFFGALLISLLFVLTVPRLLNRALEPDTTYPLYGFRYAAHRAIARLTNVPYFTHLFGDSSYIVHYLRFLGYDLSTLEQTGSNFGLEVKHENPFLTSVGAGTMAADGLSFVNTDYSSTSFRLSQAGIGARNFLGNYVVYPSQGRTGEDCLLATKVMIPVDGKPHHRTGLLGSPSFEIPRSVQRDKRFDHLRRGSEFRRRLAAKNRHNAVTISLFLLTQWIYAFGITALVAAAAATYDVAGAAAIAAAVSLLVPFRIGYFGLVERAAIGFRALRPRFCSIYEPYFWWHERYWKLSVQPPRVLNGTPFKSLAWRALGVRVGKRLFDDGLRIVEKSLVTIGDDCAFNARSTVHPHSQEDGTFKSDRITIGAGCAVGANALIHYGVTMGDGAALAPDSFLMKGEEVPPNTRWGMNPARELRRPAGGERRTEADRQSSHDDSAGGFTPIPRWTLQPMPGVADHREAVPDDLIDGVRRLADELDVPVSTVLLAAHAKVLASLTGESEVGTGYLAVAGGPPLPCRLETEADSWRSLVLGTRLVESELGSPRASGVDESADEIRLPETSFETELDPTSDGGDPAEAAVLRVGFTERDGELALRLAYRSEALDAECASRIAGYHVAALGLIAADPDAEPARQSLLSTEELRFQLDGLTGPRRELPEHRFHELFERRAAAHPDTIAAVQGDRQWTYGELNARANRLGRALLARGLRREGIVAVVTERNLDWMAAVLAIFKTGGVYLPVEPGFPADRIGAMLSRAGCELALTEPGSTTTLERAVESMPRFETLRIDEALEEGRADGDLSVEVGPDQLAYIYFTSGSTGEPKGAMCAHAGMLNHLYAKVDDLDLREGQTVAQIAPQSFDISLWQLVSGLLVGGRTLIVEQELILDLERFLKRIVDAGVNVLQVVPSYLDALLSHLEQYPRELPDLRCVSVTGEALKRELVERWFALQPGVRLVNAYGLTETSDDTNHEVMTRAPDSDRVPLGRPVNNVRLYVVDEHLSPVPLGAPGEIVFSGICVGRGYVNDPERTRLAFLEDPHRQGQRLYRSGDLGRWRPDGKLEFLGRRDAQVKIRGFRIEIGEVESALAQVPGVRSAAAVVAEGPAGGRRLIAFYSGQPIEVDALRAVMGESLPSYMIPAAVHWCESLPLTANGKVDRKSLTAIAEEPRATRSAEDRTKVEVGVG